MSDLSLETGFYARRYFPSLDGLRALSIVPVVWHHCTPYTYPGVLGRGPVGVDLFFAISGFLITTLLWRERQRGGTVDLVGFYVRRSARIFPLYFLVLALNAAYAYWIRPDWEPSRRFLARVPYYATYTANWVEMPELAGPALFVFAWSLCVEEQFYAFFAPLMKLTRRLSWVAGAMGLCVVADLLFEANAFGWSMWVPKRVFVVVTSFATPIGFGALLALAVHHPRCGKTLLRLTASGYVAPLVFAVLLSLVVWPWAPVVVLHALLAILVLVCATEERHGLSKLLENAVASYLGRVSYGIYLWHVAVIGCVKLAWPNLEQEPARLFALAFPLSVLTAGVSYRYFEQPIILRARRFYGELTMRSATTVARDEGV